MANCADAQASMMGVVSQCGAQFTCVAGCSGPQQCGCFETCFQSGDPACRAAFSALISCGRRSCESACR